MATTPDLILLRGHAEIVETHTQLLREGAVAAYLAGGSMTDISEACGITRQTLYRWIRTAPQAGEGIDSKP